MAEAATPLGLDASYGEGGGQVLRTALALAVTLGWPVTLERVRARRPKPGLQPQHLAVVRALAAIGDAAVSGDALGSTTLSFAPRARRAGDYRFDVGTAGSVSLLFQSLLLPLARAGGPSRLILVGGTHVPWSPPVHYLTSVFLPALETLGLRAGVRLRRWGWYPAGGGEIEATIEPMRGLDGFVASGPPPRAIEGVSAVSRLPRTIADRQRARAEERLRAADVRVTLAVEEDRAAIGAGTMLFLYAPGRAGFTALGRRGLRAESVADDATDACLAWLASGAAVDEHLADQLVPFLALATTSSSFTCPAITGHLRTVAWVVEQFLPVTVVLRETAPAAVAVTPHAPRRSG